MSEASNKQVRLASRPSGWVTDGKLKYWETVDEGIQHASRAFIKMLKGENTGKQIVQLAAE